MSYDNTRGAYFNKCKTDLTPLINKKSKNIIEPFSTTPTPTPTTIT